MRRDLSIPTGANRVLSRYIYPCTVCFFFHLPKTSRTSRFSRFRLIHQIAKRDYWPRHVCVSVFIGPHGTARLPLDGFYSEFIFDFFFLPKICWKNFCQELQVPYMKTYTVIPRLTKTIRYGSHSLAETWFPVGFYRKSFNSFWMLPTI